MRRLPIYLLAIIVPIESFAQSSSSVMKPPIQESIHSPNASDLGKYGDVPVSLYTGTPSVSVPIYKLAEAGIPLDIRLNYDATGVRVNSVPGWVGQNWSLDAGGVITRSVRGRSADEYDITRGMTDSQAMTFIASNGNNDCQAFSWPCTTNLNIYHQGYKNSTRYLTTANWYSTQKLDSIRVHSIFDAWNYSQYVPPMSYMQAVKNYQPDMEPDIFTFNFMGHTGKFFLAQDGQWKVQSESNIKVVCDFSQDWAVPITTPATQWEFGRIYPRVITSFTLIDDEGNKFRFGFGNSYELTFPNFFDQKKNEVTTSAWYLQSVYDKFGNMVYKFDYERGPYLGHFYLDWGTKLLEWPGAPFTESNVTPYTSWSSTWDGSSIKAPGQLILPVYLKKITSQSGLTVELASSVASAMKFASNDSPLINPAVWDFGNNPTDPDWNYFVTRLPDFTTPNTEYVGNSSILNLLKWKKLDNIVVKKNSVTLFNYTFTYENSPQRRLFLKGVSMSDGNYAFEYNNDHLLPNFLSSAIDHLGYYDGTPFSFTPSGSAFNFWRSYSSQRNSSATYMQYGSLKKITYPTKGYTQYEFEPHQYAKEIDKDGTLIATTPSEKIIGGLRIKKIINNDGFGNNYVKEYQYTNDFGSSNSSGSLLIKPIYIAEDISLPHGTAGQPYFQQYGMREININPLIPMTNLMGATVEYATVIEKQSYFRDGLTEVNSNGYTITKFSDYSQFPDGQPLGSLVPSYNFNFPRIDMSFARGKVLETKVYDQANVLKKRLSYQYGHNTNHKVNAIKMYIFDISCTNCQAAANENLMSAYQIYYSDRYLTEKKEEDFTPAGTISKTETYTYRHYPETAGTIANGGDIFLDASFLESSQGGGTRTTVKYPFDLTGTVPSHMVAAHILEPTSMKSDLLTGTLSSPGTVTALFENKTDYIDIQNGFGDDVPVPSIFSARKGTNAFENKFHFLRYAYTGNLTETKNADGISTSKIWGYNNTRVVAEIKNMAYTSIDTNIITQIQSASNTGTETQLLQALTNLRSSLPGVMMTTYTYTPFLVVSTITDEKTNKTSYEYDANGRLKTVRNDQGNIISENEYHYKP